jgi:hypothetical protein
MRGTSDFNRLEPILNAYDERKTVMHYTAVIGVGEGL